MESGVRWSEGTKTGEVVEGLIYQISTPEEEKMVNGNKAKVP
jgi:hypothetical protein